MGGVDYTKSKTHTSYADPPKRMVLGRFYLDENGYGYRPGRKKMVYEQGEKAAQAAATLPNIAAPALTPRAWAAWRCRERTVNGGRRMPPHEARKYLILLECAGVPSSGQ